MASIVAANDAASAINGTAGAANVLNVFAGDTVGGVQAGPANGVLQLADGSNLPAGLTFDPATGNVSVASGTAAGTYSFDYSLCEIANPSNCKTATVSIEVTAGEISAVDDAVSGINGLVGAAGVLDVIPGDLLNGQQVELADVAMTITSTATPVNGGPVPVLNIETGLVDVSPGTPAGIYAIGYQICEKLNPTNCATAVASVTVVAAPLSANSDAPVPVNSAVGGKAIINAFANDTLNGVSVATGAIVATVTSPAMPINGASVPVLNPETGDVDVPPGTAAGTYTISYQICERLNPANCATGTITIVVEAAVGSVSGTVYSDLNSDRRLDEGDLRQAGWIVELVVDGKLVATTTSNIQGNYRFAGLPAGVGYTVRFRNPENNVVYDQITDIRVGANETIVDQNLPIDPSGVVYNSVTRNPLAGVTLGLADASGNLLPAACFIDASQRSQVTGPSGAYRFDIVPGADAACPVDETIYRIVVTPPSGYSSPSSVLLPQAGDLDPTGRGDPFLVAASANPPTDGSPIYYLTFRLQLGDPNVVHNHIPLDPFLTRDPLVVTKTSPRRSAGTGDLVPYEIVVRNTENVQRAGVDVIDILPPGMKYVLGSASVDGIQLEPVEANSGRELVWRNQVIPANGVVSYTLTLVVGAGIASGEKTNTGVAENGATGSVISNRGTSTVSIVPSAVFDCSELLGKVFEDINRNGYQDEGEPGLPGARLVTVNGQLVTTDEYGRYHIACAAVPDARIGSNFVLKLDPRSLPLGWEPTTDNPRSIRLTRGKFGELNFGVAPQEAKTPADRLGEGE
ncbi:SdrD B-like domain-containing protein [Parerythrobacter aurantius]|uniref:SdrD B-like domain-containing protein n=1 Tax=Parerythrobacter aurantius TaxID=3127706 RepID=UPI0032561BE0